MRDETEREERKKEAADVARNASREKKDPKERRDTSITLGGDRDPQDSPSRKSKLKRKQKKNNRTHRPGIEPNDFSTQMDGDARGSRKIGSQREGWKNENSSKKSEKASSSKEFEKVQEPLLLAWVQDGAAKVQKAWGGLTGMATME